MNDRPVIFVYVSPVFGFYTIRGKLHYGMSRRPQLGFQYMCAALEAKGFASDILDQTVTPFDEKELAEILKARNPLFVGFYTVDAMVEILPPFIRGLKEHLPDVPLVVGGPGTLRPEPYLEAGAEMACVGEGEITVVEMAEYYSGQRGRDSLKGVCWLENGVKVSAPPQSQVSDLDVLPFPIRDKVDINAYYDYYIYNMQKPFAVVMASRGCAYHCTFCTSHEIWEGKVRFRSPANVVAEIEHLVRDHGVRFINFADDVFGLKNSWAREFCERMIEARLPVKWMCNLHPFSFRADRAELMRLMAKAGCNTVVLGLQSADAQVLKNIRRKESEPDSAKELIAEARKNGMLTAMGYIFGLPGDTAASITRTIDYVFSCEPHVADFYVLKVLFGSQIDRDFPNRDMTALTEAELWRMASDASRRFYSNPGTLARNAAYVLRHKPSWLLIAARNFGNLVTVTGLNRFADRFWGGRRDSAKQEAA